MNAALPDASNTTLPYSSVDQALFDRIWEELSLLSNKDIRARVYPELDDALVYISPAGDCSVQQLAVVAQREPAEPLNAKTWLMNQTLYVFRRQIGHKSGKWIATSFPI